MNPLFPHTLIACKCKIHPKHQIKSSLHSWYFAEVCNEWRGPQPSALPAQIRRNVAVSSLTGPGIEPNTFRTVSGGFNRHTNHHREYFKTELMHSTIKLILQRRYQFRKTLPIQNY